MAERPFERVRVTVIDGVGCGEEIDRRGQYPRDVGVNSLVNASQVEPLNTPALQSIGLRHISGLEGIPKNPAKAPTKMVKMRRDIFYEFQIKI